jgi:hypothetical protein
MAILQCALFLIGEPAISILWLREDAAEIDGWHMPVPGWMHLDFAPIFFIR